MSVFLLEWFLFSVNPDMTYGFDWALQTHYFLTLLPVVFQKYEWRQQEKTAHLSHAWLWQSVRQDIPSACSSQV